MIVDWRVTDKEAKQGIGFYIENRWPNSDKRELNGDMQSVTGKKAGERHRTTIKVTENGITAETDGAVSGSIPGPGADKTWNERRFCLRAPDNPIQFANIYIKELSK